MNDVANQPIIACSTGNSPSGIAVLRLSGNFQVSDFKRIIKLKDFQGGSIEPRRVYRAGIYRDEKLLDDALLTYFKGPKSYTGEDIIELSIHGNPLNTQRIIDAFVEFYQFNTARGGEFTLRALKNKKISLSQVEGLDLMLNATSLYAYDSGLSLLDGETHQLYLKLHELLLKHRSALELLSDFSDDVGADISVKLLQSTFNSFLDLFMPLAQRVTYDASSLLNPHIVIYGSPNAGKSTFFNQFLKKDRAIVSPIAGTTRDYLTEKIVIGGTCYTLSDTAGLRSGSLDVIENIGIERTKGILGKAFFKILVIDPSNFSDLDINLTGNGPDLILFTHSDIAPIGPTILGKIINFKCLQNKDDFIEHIEKAIKTKYSILTEQKPILLERQRYLIKKLSSELQSYQRLIFSGESDIAVVASELIFIQDLLSELLGVITVDDVYHHIFNNFCIGK